MQGNRKPEGDGPDDGGRVRPARASVIPRRDERAEPDDDDIGTGRVDVVSFERDNPTSGVGTLRRELARLHQQASAVERSFEDQRRERKDHQERLDRATERIVQLEARVDAAENEASNQRQLNESVLQDNAALRSERDDLLRVVETAKIATADLAKHKTEADDQKARADRLTKELLKLEADITDLKKRQFQEALKVTDKDTELGGMREKLVRAGEETEQAKNEATRAKADVERALAEVSESKAALAKAQGETTAARADAASARADATRAREEATKAREEATKAREEVTKSKEDNVRDRATARDRIDLLERALDDARAVSMRWETDYENLRMEREAEARRASEELAAANDVEARVRRELEDALTTAAQSEERASAAVSARTALEDAVLRVRDDVAAAFSRLEGAASSPFTTRSASVIPRPSVPPMAPPAGSRSTTKTSGIPEALDDDWASPSSVEPGTRPGLGGESLAPDSPPSPASKSVPPPASSAVLPSTTTTTTSVPAPTYASVPPQLHEKPDSMPPMSKQVTMPPPAGIGVDLEGLVESAYGKKEADAEAKADAADANDANSGTTDSESNPVRVALFAKLVDPANANEAAAELTKHEEWLNGTPPPAFVAALSGIDYDADGPIFGLARAWERDPLCQALLGTLRAEPDSRLREHTAWLLKHFGTAPHAKAIADLAKSDDESIQTRRWLLEGLDRLAAGRSIGWKEVGDAVTAVGRHSDASLRDGVVGLLVSLDRSDEKRKALLEILRADNDEGVIANAVNGLANVLPIELDPAMVERLLGHPSPRVQRSVRELIERAKQR